MDKLGPWCIRRVSWMCIIWFMDGVHTRRRFPISNRPHRFYQGQILLTPHHIKFCTFFKRIHPFIIITYYYLPIWVSTNLLTLKYINSFNFIFLPCFYFIIIYKYVHFYSGPWDVCKCWCGPWVEKASCKCLLPLIHLLCLFTCAVNDKCNMYPCNTRNVMHTPNSHQRYHLDLFIELPAVFFFYIL